MHVSAHSPLIGSYLEIIDSTLGKLLRSIGGLGGSAELRIRTVLRLGIIDLIAFGIGDLIIGQGDLAAGGAGRDILYLLRPDTEGVRRSICR